jgi:hypothetical protein
VGEMRFTGSRLDRISSGYPGIPFTHWDRGQLTSWYVRRGNIGWPAYCPMLPAELYDAIEMSREAVTRKIATARPTARALSVPLHIGPTA